jgi:effector-binding domain-containing protein
LRWVTIVTASKHMIMAMSHDYEKKVRDIKEFFSKECNAVQRAEIAEKYGANYIIVRRSVNDNIQIQGYRRMFLNKEYEIWAAETVPTIS